LENEPILNKVTMTNIWMHFTPFCIGILFRPYAPQGAKTTKSSQV